MAIRFMEQFVPMAYDAGCYEVLLRGGLRIPAEDYGHLCSTPDYVACFYQYRNYRFNRPTFFGTPLIDADGRPYILAWRGFCVWAFDPKRVYRVYHVEGESVFLKQGSIFYKSLGRRPPVPDRAGLARRTRLALGEW